MPNLHVFSAFILFAFCLVVVIRVCLGFWERVLGLFGFVEGGGVLACHSHSSPTFQSS